jgi:peptidyl-prolyl cis-trans isomerase C
MGSPFRTRIARWQREPLVHFALLGALVFTLHRATSTPSAPREIVLTPSLLRGLRADHLRRTGAVPTAEEEAALVARFVDDEVLYREALALGLDRGDVIVRRRMIQKMQLLTEDLEPGAEPTEADLESWLAGHREAYAVPLRVSLEHVFVGRSQRVDPTGDAAAIRAALAAGADPADLGDPFILGRRTFRRTEQELAAAFGSVFAARAVALVPGAWSEPLASSYGLHVVRVTERLAARSPDLAEVRAAVRHDWLEAERTVANRVALDRLRATYAVRAELGATDPGPLATAR